MCGDVQDLYLERLNDDGTAARYEDSWEPLTIHREEIRVRGSDEPIVHEVRATRHGPLLDSYLTGRLRPGEAPARGDLRAPLGGRRAQHPPVRADRRGERHDLRGVPGGGSRARVPGQNLVYADVDGTIGYQCTGLHPVRRDGDGTTPVPGWTAEHEWEGFIPFEELPFAVDPDRGYLVTANDRIHDEGYPHLIGARLPCARSRGPDHRAPRGAVGPHRGDVSPDPGRHRLDLGAIARPTDIARGRRARALLDGWDHDLTAGSAAAALWEVLVDELARRAVGGEEPLVAEYLSDRELFRCRALPSAPRRGHPHRGAVRRRASPSRGIAASTRWAPTPATGAGVTSIGRVFAHPLGRMPGLEPLFVAAEHPLGGDEQTVNNAGFEGDGPFRVYVVPSWRAVYDLSDLDASRGILPTGQSGNPASPHWNDQTDLWAAGELRPLPFTRGAVEERGDRASRARPGVSRGPGTI